MNGYSGNPIFHPRPESCYLLASLLAGGSALIIALNGPPLMGLATLVVAAICLVVGLALHGAPADRVTTNGGEAPDDGARPVGDAGAEGAGIRRKAGS